MLRRKHPHPTESIDTLRSSGLKRFTEVYTADGERLGVSLRFIHRPIEDVNVEQKLYRSYLVVQSLQHGGPVFVPTLFVEIYDPTAGRVTLSADLEMVQNEIWNREPDFMAHGRAVAEELPA